VRAMSDTLDTVSRLVTATNAHDIDALVDCFAAEYVNETPAHPQRGFRGRDQVRRNWTSIFAGVPDIAVRVVASVDDGGTAWTEWEMSGTRRDGAPHAMAGVIIFGVSEDRIAWARFYLEQVEQTSGDVNAAVDRATKAPSP
jgi:ketosteroid isomerase-like protein